jgi:hypothetical protein
MLLLSIKSNDSYIYCSINDNIITCDNKIILSDIKKKILTIDKNYKHISFYILKQSYIGDDAFSITVNDLPFSFHPIYKKDDDLKTFLHNYCDFCTLDVRAYETKKFDQYIHDFTNKEICLQLQTYHNTNKEFKNFLQTNYHAGNHSNISRHGILPMQTFFNFELIENKIKDKIYINQSGIINTLLYMFDYLKRGIMVGIKDNKIVIFLPFSKHNYKNDYFEELYFDENDKRNLAQYKKNRNPHLKEKLEKTVKYYFRKYNVPNKDTIWDREKWFANNCFFRHDTWEGDKLVISYLDMIMYLCDNRKINDCVFMLNVRDFPVLRKDRKHPYSIIVDKDIPTKYVKEFCPILSVGASDEYDDIPLITPDDWTRVSQRFYPVSCKNPYDTINESFTVPWEDKIEKAVFRGGATGCGLNIETNMRLLATQMSIDNPDLLDVGMTSFNRRIKKIFNKSLTIANKSRYSKASFMSITDKEKYKYILNIDGHVTAFRLGHELKMKCVMLLVKSHYHIWFSKMLIPYEHYIPIKCDLSDLLSQIRWCKNNDEKCKQISLNALDFYNKHLQMDGVLDYMANTLNKIVLYKELSVKKINIALIACYRDNVIHSRYMEKAMFIYSMSKMLNYHNVNYKILIVEQNCKDKFNIGKLKNIGFDYINTKESFDNYIFTDIDMIPDHELIKKYFTVTNGMNTLAIRGTRYNEGRKEFFGGCISCTKSIFLQINGYSNLFSRGWGGEDENLSTRVKMEKITNYVPDKGNIIDIEETDSGYKKLIKDKLEEEIVDKEKYEYSLKYKLYKEDGLSNLKYKLDYENINKNIYHIIVDPLQKQFEKDYPIHHDITDFTMDKYKDYKNFLKRLNIDQKKF